MSRDARAALVLVHLCEVDLDTAEVIDREALLATMERMLDQLDAGSNSDGTKRGLRHV
jgi:hypothetical protein